MTTKPTREEYAERRERWAEALESGKYAQTKGALRDRNGYCCLGVACDLYAKDTGEAWKKDADGYQFLYNVGSLPQQVCEWLGLKDHGFGTYCGQFWVGGGIDSLAGRNDGGASFQEIAELIRAAPEGLYVDD